MKTPAFFKSFRRSPRKLLALILPLALFAAGWWFGLPPSEKDHSAHSGESKTTWTCSMHPQIRQPKPGLCPICNMDLIPLDGDESAGLRELSISAEASALLDIRVTPAVRAPAEAQVRLFGRIDYDERTLTTITSRVAGRLDRLFVDFTGAVVRKGDHLAEIYSPELLVAQRELIESRRALNSLPAGSSAIVRDTRRRLLNSAREKLRLLQFSEKQISEIEQSEQPGDNLTLYAPQSGIVTAKLASEGQYVKTGDPLFRVADLSKIWLKLEAYESDLQWIRYAQDVEFTVAAVPGKTFHGRVAFIDPEIDTARRVAKVRVNVENEQNFLKPGMFAEAVVRSETATNGKVIDRSLDGKWISPMHPEIVKDQPGQCDICGMDLVPAKELGFVSELKKDEEPLLIPVSAVLRTGTRAIVYVRVPEETDPTFEGREIVLGPQVGGKFIVDSGLSEGELVVTRGAFKLDSELQIRAKPSMMNPNAGLTERPAGTAPEILTGQWSPVPRALHRMMANPTGETLSDLRKLIEAIDGSKLQPKDAELWKEFSSRLSNQLVTAAKRITTEPQIAAKMTARAVEEAGIYLGLPYQAEPPPVIDPATAKALKATILKYLPIADALAKDDSESAGTAATSFADFLNESTLPEAKELSEMARSIAKSAEMKAKRAAFELLSSKIISMTRDRGIDAVGNAYVVHCPMAFSGKGADWISNKPAVENPYFGNAMFDCGTITDTLSVDKK